MHFTVGQFILYQISPMSVLIHCKQMLISFPLWAAFWRGGMTHCSTSLCLWASVWDLTSGWIRLCLGRKCMCVCVFSMFTASVCTGIMLIYPEPLERGLWNAIKPVVRGYHEGIYYLDHIRLSRLCLAFHIHFYRLHSQISVLMHFTYIKHNSISYIHILQVFIWPADRFTAV